MQRAKLGLCVLTLTGCAVDEAIAEFRDAPGACLPSECGERSASGCYCDDECVQYGDCCSNHEAVCSGEVSQCGGPPSACGEQATSGCWCDASCSEYGDCCADYATACGAGGDEGGSGDGYYASIDPQAQGSTMVNALHDLIDDHDALSYSELWNAFAVTDGGVSGCSGIYDIYSSQCWTSSSQRCGSYSEEGDCYNREHSWPHSWWGGTQDERYTDLFHLYPTDGYVNGIRGNLPYCEIVESQANYVSSNGAKRGPCETAGYSGLGFEPPEAFKGDLARTYFYMAVRYEGEFTCCGMEGVSGPNLQAWLEAQLRAWHTQDPVSAKEIARNEAIFGLQGNRNPFIDHPEWVARIGDF